MGKLWGLSVIVQRGINRCRSDYLRNYDIFQYSVIEQILSVLVISVSHNILIWRWRLLWADRNTMSQAVYI